MNAKKQLAKDIPTKSITQHENIDTTDTQGDVADKRNPAKSIVLNVEAEQRTTIENNDAMSDIVVEVLMEQELL